MANAELDESLGPLRTRPQRDELRQQLTRQLVIPGTLRIAVDGEEIVLDEGRSSPRRFYPGEPYARVDAMGTAKITAAWARANFQVIEKYDSHRSNRETYAVDQRSGNLVVTRVVERPGMKDIVLRSVYLPAATPIGR